MKRSEIIKILFFMLLALILAPASFVACSPSDDSGSSDDSGTKTDTSRYLVVVEDKPDTVDFQCTTIQYTIALNVFDRLVEMKTGENGEVAIEPSLAESWDISEDGKRYTFHLREGVSFSNGSALTSSDVLYSFRRLLTYPDACNQEFIEPIAGAHALEEGKTSELKGFEILSDTDFTITLEEPFAAFLAFLSTPPASIMDEESTEKAGERFGKEAENTIGTGSYILDQWDQDKGMLLRANRDSWKGAPKNDGIQMLFLSEQEDIRKMFDDGKLDILDFDDIGNSAEYYLHGDIYQDRIYEVPRIAITYIALNESVKPLDDVRVRKALQLALDRELLLDALYDGYGEVENGIFPHGLYGFDPDLPQIPYDPEKAKELLAKAGYANGCDLTISVKSSSTLWDKKLIELASDMWEDIGVRTEIVLLEEGDFMKQRMTGKLDCYTAMWTADYDDPDNFIYTFFGTPAKTEFRSLCYPKEDIMKRVQKARTIMDPDRRLKEYNDLEKIIVQEDAAWIPLYSRRHHYVVSERVGDFSYAWNGSVKNMYDRITIKEEK